MTDTQHKSNSILVQAIQDKLSLEAVEAKLFAEGHDEVSIALLLREFKKLSNAKRQSKGFVLMAIGAFLGLMSCLLTIINPIPALYNVILFGMTSIAIGIAFVGMYFVFE